MGRQILTRHPKGFVKLLLYAILYGWSRNFSNGEIFLPHGGKQTHTGALARTAIGMQSGKERGEKYFVFISNSFSRLFVAFIREGKENKNMITQAMVLAAGEGRRLRPLTDHTPKPLIPVGNKTMLDHALDALEKVGVTQCVVNTYHLGNQIETHLKGRTSPKILISREKNLLDTGGGIAKALPHFKGQPFFVLNADIWWQDKNHSALKELEKMWDSSKMDALILLMPREKAIGFEGPGDYFLKESGQIYHRGQEATAPYIFTGIRILHPRLLEGEEVRPFSIIPLFHQAEKNGRLYGLVYDGEWGDIGTLSSLEIIQKYSGQIHAQRNR